MVTGSMKTMTVRDVRQKWPEAERMLGKVGEIVITRDGKPVARLLPMEVVEADVRSRFDPEENRKRREKLWGKGVVIDSLSGLLEDREDRNLL
jgi:antitoxin (DNA-binding transcriptional repressor) of toxin-antitoxin stability system